MRRNKLRILQACAIAAACGLSLTACGGSGAALRGGAAATAPPVALSLLPSLTRAITSARLALLRLWCWGPTGM